MSIIPYNNSEVEDTRGHSESKECGFYSPTPVFNKLQRNLDTKITSRTGTIYDLFINNLLRHMNQCIKLEMVYVIKTIDRLGPIMEPRC